MGVYLYLHIVPERIGQDEWARAYDDTLRLLQNHPSQIMGIDWREIFGVEVIMYVHEIEQEVDDAQQRCWHIVGDFQSKRHAESFTMYRSLTREEPWARGPCEQADGENDDILLMTLQERPGVRRVFGSKTQGEPYHLPVLAAAMIVEHRFPYAAMVDGDFDRDDAEQARDLVESILGQSVALPVRVDGPALWARLSALAERGVLDTPIDEAFDELFLGDQTETLAARLTVASGREREALVLEKLRRAPSPSQPSTQSPDEPPGNPPEKPPSSVIRAWLDATGDLETLCRLACHDERGPRHTPEAMVDALAGCWHASAAVSQGAPATAGPGHDNAPLHPLLALVLGKPLRAAMPAETIEAILARVFPDDSERLLALLRAKMTELDRLLRTIKEGLARIAGPEPGRWHTNLADLATLDSPDELSDVDRTNIEYLIAGLLKARQKQPEPLPPDAAECKHLIATLLAERHVLTEDAWAWIAEEDDMEILHFLLVLALVKSPPEPAYSVRRALFENPALCHFAASLATSSACSARTPSA